MPVRLSGRIHKLRGFGLLNTAQLMKIYRTRFSTEQPPLHRTSDAAN